MNVEYQRKAGIRLTSDIDAARTMALIEDPSAGYQEIFRMATHEIGADKLAKLVLEQNEPDWALNAVRHIPGIDAEREALLAQAAPLYEACKKVDAAALAKPLAKIAALELDIQDGVSYSAYFTMFWNSGSNAEPATGYQPAKPPCKWSNEVWTRQSAANLCKYFGLPKGAPKPGDTVWMVVDVCDGGWYETPFAFTYDPTGDTAVITADGEASSPSFTYRIKT